MNQFKILLMNNCSQDKPEPVKLTKAGKPVAPSSNTTASHYVYNATHVKSIMDYAISL